jgi:hypothetical protein
MLYEWLINFMSVMRKLSDGKFKICLWIRFRGCSLRNLIYFLFLW